MPWLERHGDGWRVCWRDGGRGTPIKKTETFAPKSRANAEMEAIGDRMSARRKTSSAAIPWGKLTQRYLLSIAGDTTEAHRGQAERCLAALAARFGWADAGDVKPEQCLHVKSYHGRIVRALLRYAVLADQLVDQRCLTVRPVKDRKAKRARDSELLTPQAVADLIAAATRWGAGNGAIAHCVAIYGHRSENLIGLTCGALNADGSLTMRVKSGDVKRVPLRAETVAILQGLSAGKDPAAALFVNHLGKTWKSGQAFSAWWGHQVATKPGQGILDLRRFATTRQMAASGQNAKAVADAQGRRTVALVAGVYQRSTAAERQGVVDALPSLPEPVPCAPGATP